jgi:hypothetical protein
MHRYIGIRNICIVPLSTRINAEETHHQHQPNRPSTPSTGRLSLDDPPRRAAPSLASPCCSTPIHSAPLRLAPLRLAPLRLAPLRSTTLRFAPLRSQLLNDNGRSRASAVADRRDSLLALLERVHEGDDDPASGRPDGLCGISKGLTLATVTWDARSGMQLGILSKIQHNLCV